MCNPVLLSDETKIKPFSHEHYHHFWWQKGTPSKEKHLIPNCKCGSGSFMLWACSMAEGPSMGNFHQVQGYLGPKPSCLWRFSSSGFCSYVICDTKWFIIATEKSQHLWSCFNTFIRMLYINY